MQVEVVCVHNDIYDNIVTFDVSQDIQIVMSEREKMMTVFYGRQEFVVRANAATLNIVDQMYDKSSMYQLFLVQVLKMFDVAQQSELAPI